MNNDELLEALVSKWSVPYDDPIEERYEELKKEFVKLQKQLIQICEERDEMLSLFKNQIKMKGDKPVSKQIYGYALIDKDDIPLRDVGVILAEDEARALCGTYNVTMSLNDDKRGPYRVIPLWYEVYHG